MSEAYALFYTYFLAAVRWILPILAIFIVTLWFKTLRARKPQTGILAVLVGEDGTRYPITAAETSIGRRKSNDIVLALPTVARQQAVLIRDADGFVLQDLSGDENMEVDGARLEKEAVVVPGDVISFGGYRTHLVRATAHDLTSVAQKKHRPVAAPAFAPILLLLSLFQMLVGLELCLKYYDSLSPVIPLSFGALILCEWITYFVNKAADASMVIELPAFFLTTLGFAVCTTAAPNTLLKELAASVAGFLVFILLSQILKHISLTMKLRYFVGIVGVGLLAVNLVLAQSVFGAKNWIDLGFITIQPSEFVKIAFVFAGAATLDHLLSKRNFLLFLGMTGTILLSLALMRDFGTASIFFVTMLIILFMRTGNLHLIALILVAAAAAIFLIIQLMPYITARFAAWGHVWEFADTSGYQQTRTMVAMGSGGLLGVGGGNGYLQGVFAADTDLVFGLIFEEWGGIVAFAALFCILALAIYALWMCRGVDSAYYAIAVCAAAGMLLFQTALNVFGSVDILPLTGVTMPFVSNGGSSIVASWGLLAFFKVADGQLSRRIAAQKQQARARAAARRTEGA